MVRPIVLIGGGLVGLFLLSRSGSASSGDRPTESAGTNFLRTIPSSSLLPTFNFPEIPNPQFIEDIPVESPKKTSRGSSGRRIDPNLRFLPSPNVSSTGFNEQGQPVFLDKPSTINKKLSASGALDMAEQAVLAGL